MHNEDNLCKICNTDPYKYECPRCNIVYCSVKCYKAEIHSNCSEAFYKECIQEFVKSQEDDPNSRKKMVEILQRVNENGNVGGYSSDDSDDVQSINERLEGINLDDADSVWDKLTVEERQEFINFIKDGEVSQLLPLWEPWWIKKYRKPKVRFVDDNESVLNFETDCPLVPKRITPLSQITKTKPSNYIFFNLVNVLGSYVVVARYYNGEHHTMINETTMILLCVSRNLSENENYQSFEIALESVLHEAENCEFLNISEIGRHEMKADVISILEGPNEEKCIYYVEAALSDISTLLKTYKKLRPTKTNTGKFSAIFPEVNIEATNKYSKELISKCIQKIKYYQSWCYEYYTPNKFLL